MIPARHCRVRTLAEVLTLAMNASAPGGGSLGVYIETKEPAFHNSLGLPLEPRVLDALEAAGYGGVPAAPLVLQSFDEQVRTHKVPLVTFTSSRPWHHIRWPLSSCKLDMAKRIPGEFLFHLLCCGDTHSQQKWDAVQSSTVVRLQHQHMGFTGGRMGCI